MQFGPWGEAGDSEAAGERPGPHSHRRAAETARSLPESSPIHDNRDSPDLRDRPVRRHGLQAWLRGVEDCLDESGRLLLVRFHEPGNPHSGKWTMPGGGMEWGEHPEDTAVREVTEETGLTPELGPVLGSWSRRVEAHEVESRQPGHVVGIVYGGTDATGTLTAEQGGSTDAARWFSLAEVEDLPTVPLVDFVVDLLGP